MINYEKISQLVTLHDVAFPKIGDSLVNDVSIAKAEAALKTLLPPSYIWWLKNYGGGQIRGDILYGLDSENDGRPDIVELAIESRRLEKNEHKLIFAISNGSEYYFNIYEPSTDGEFNIYELEYGYDEILFARSFSEFLIRRITSA